MGDVFGNENLISVLFCIVQLQNMLSSDTGYSWIPHPTCDKTKVRMITTELKLTIVHVPQFKFSYYLHSTRIPYGVYSSFSLRANMFK